LRSRRESPSRTESTGRPPQVQPRTDRAVRNPQPGGSRQLRGRQPWDDQNLAFIHLPPHLIGNIEKDVVSLDIEKNSTKPEPNDFSSLIRGHAVFGLVEALTGETTRQNGRAVTLLRGVMAPGELRDFNPSTATLECFETNLADLPHSFGGTSGGGLWRVYLRKNEDESFEVIHYRLIGIASRETKGVVPPRIMCQSIGLVEGLLENVRKDLGQGITSAL